MINFRLLKNSDPILWICSGLLILIGFLSIYSATFAMLSKKAAIITTMSIDPFMFLKRHFFTFFLGSIALSFFAYMDYSRLKDLGKWFYAVTIISLLVVLFLGYESSGAQRWLSVAGFTFQPSELAKLVLIMVIAIYININSGIKNFSDLVPLSIIAGLPFLLIFKQPDLGTSLVFIAIMFGMMLWANESSVVLLFLLTPLISIILSPILLLWIPYLIIVSLLVYFFRFTTRDSILIFGVNLLSGAFLPLVWHFLKDYQRQRLLIFMNPFSDPYGSGYHTIQSQIAIGAGGLFGRGYLSGTQTQLQFIPEQWTDFIFSMIGEEFGFIGSMLVIILFTVLIWRAVEIAINAGDFFGSLLAGGIAIMFLFHVAVNIGMTLGIAPVVGIPLPLISYGGTSLIMNMSAIGILQSISMRRVKVFF